MGASELFSFAHSPSLLKWGTLTMEFGNLVLHSQLHLRLCKVKESEEHGLGGFNTALGMTSRVILDELYSFPKVQLPQLWNGVRSWGGGIA